MLGPRWHLLRATLWLAKRMGRYWPRRQHPIPAGWQPGLSILIPDRASPALLAECLAALEVALRALAEPYEIIVSCSEARPADYRALADCYPQVRWLHSRRALGYARAIARGMRSVRYDHVYLLNNDVCLEPQALSSVLALRGASVFAVASQIVFADTTRRREETGLTAAYGYPDQLTIYDVEPGTQAPAVEHLYAGGGASLFRSAPLRRYVGQACAYEPVYWEDVEWGWRARTDGWSIRYCAQSIAVHHHRATVNRIYSATEIDRIVARNALQFHLRNLVEASTEQLLERFAAMPTATRRELTTIGRLGSQLRRRATASSEAIPSGWYLSRHAIDIQLGKGDAHLLPTLVCATPYALLPTTHGGARRTLELLAALSPRYRIVLVSDEAELYPPLAIKQLPWLSALLLVSGRAPAVAECASMRRNRHAWAGLREALVQACDLYPPDHVLICYEELADLVRLRQAGQRWTLDLHDVNVTLDQQICEPYDTVLATSAEDLAQLMHRHCSLVANGSSVRGQYQPSADEALSLLFVGNLRYPPNRVGLQQFVQRAWPQIKKRHRQLSLHLAGIDPAEALQLLGPVDGLVALGPRQDLGALYFAATLTINPLEQTRGSALKIAESLTAGRICIATRSGARGFADLDAPALVCCDTIEAMAPAICALLDDRQERWRRERPSPGLLRCLSWETQAEKLHRLWTTSSEALPQTD